MPYQISLFFLYLLGLIQLRNLTKLDVILILVRFPSYFCLNDSVICSKHWTGIHFASVSHYQEKTVSRQQIEKLNLKLQTLKLFGEFPFFFFFGWMRNFWYIKRATQARKCLKAEPARTQEQAQTEELHYKQPKPSSKTTNKPETVLSPLLAPPLRR